MRGVRVGRVPKRRRGHRVKTRSGKEGSHVAASPLVFCGFDFA